MSGDHVNYQRLLRIFILTDIFAMVGGVIASAIFEGTLPEPLRTYVATEELHPFVLIVALLLLILLIVAWAGLWRNASWAPPVYAVMWVSCVVVVPFSGPYVGTGIEEMFDFVGTSAGGGILALVLLATQGRRRPGLSASVGGEPTLEAVKDAGGPNRPDEQLPPHLKAWRVHQVLAALYGLITLMLLALPFVARSGKEELNAGDVARAFVFPLFFFALAVLHHVVSRGAKKRKRWARIGSIVLACLLVPAVPVGTLIGIYLLRNVSWEASRHGVVGSRMSCHAFGANQFRLLLHVAAYVLMFVLREELEPLSTTRMQMDTLRLRVLKVAAVVKVSARRIWLHLSAEHPSVSLFRYLGAALAPT